MELRDLSRDRRQTWLLGLAFVVAIFVAGAPVVEAAVSRVNVTRSVPIRIRDTTNGLVDADEVGSHADPGKLGLFGAPGSRGAVATRTFAGGGGLLGEGDCYDATARPAVSTIDPDASGNDRIVTAIILTGTDATVTVDAPGLGATLGEDVIKFRVNATNPNEFVGLGNGLSVSPSPLVFTCTGTNGEFVVLGQ